MQPTRPYTIDEDLELKADLGWRFCPRHGLARHRTKNNPLGDLSDVKDLHHTGRRWYNILLHNTVTRSRIL